MIELPVLKHNGQRILTTQQLAEIYETSTNNIQNNFINHKDNFVQGKHYYLLKGEELREFKREVNNIDLVKNNVNQLYLWTERGANRHCKILDTDKAWEQFDNLEETYFKVKEEKLSGENLIALAVIEAQKLLFQKDEEIEMKNQEITELKPKAEYHDRVLNKEDLFSITFIAKDLGLSSAAKLNKLLCHNKIIFKDKSGAWHPYSNYEWLIKENYCDYVSYPIAGVPILKWTEKGRKWIVENFEKWEKKMETLKQA